MNKPPEAPPQMTVDLSVTEDVTCDKCGDLRFEPIWMIKKVPALVSPTGREELVPLGPPICPPLFACLACGHVNEQFLPAPLRAANKKKEEAEDNIESSAPPPLYLTD